MIAMATAFLRRDFLIKSSYRMAFFWELAGAVVVFIPFYFVSQLVGQQLTESTQPLSADYFDFLITGLAFTDIFGICLLAFSRAIRDGQNAGTLEPMLLAHSRLLPIVLCSSTFSFLQSLGRLAIFTTIAVVVFGLWHDANLLSVLIVFLLGMTTFACLGILSAAFNLVLKQGDPVMNVYGLVTLILGGIFFPVSLLPDWIQPFAVLVPLYHALSGMRLALRGTAPWEMGGEVSALLLMAAICLPACIVAFNWAVNRAKEEGSLVQY